MTRRRPSVPTLTRLLFVCMMALVSVSTNRATANDAARPGEPANTAASPIDYAAYAAALSTHVSDDGFVDYTSLKAHRADLDQFVKQLAVLDAKAFNAWPEADRLALLINAYNAFTLRLIIDHYPIKSGFFASLRFPRNSIRQIGGAWDKVTFNLMGRNVTLEHIEHEMLRKQYHEPRLHMAINCASVGCPPLRNEPFTGDKLDEQLDAQSGRFMATAGKFRIDRKAGVVYLSPIFKWFGDDFVAAYKPASGFGNGGEALRAVLHFASRHVGASDATFLSEGRYDTAWLDYDWTLNERK
ncbi:MAG: DUF547 domain-containing protein [Phycisphaera sp.]|nr:DUF547 domain-containing protein [Phycisphaera sp.]